MWSVEAAGAEDWTEMDNHGVAYTGEKTRVNIYLLEILSFPSVKTVLHIVNCIIL